MGWLSSEKTSFLLSRRAASAPHLLEAGDDRNLDQKRWVLGSPREPPFVCLPEAPADIVHRCVAHAFACNATKIAWLRCLVKTQIINAVIGHS